jgi:hypothetical protein
LERFVCALVYRPGYNGSSKCTPTLLTRSSFFATDLFCSLPDPKLDALEVQLIGEKCNI